MIKKNRHIVRDPDIPYTADTNTCLSKTYALLHLSTRIKPFSDCIQKKCSYIILMKIA
jgi:hypothetical protein